MPEKEYIERGSLLEWVREFYPEEKVFASAIINAPAADVQEVRHGKWVKHKFDPQFLNTLHSKGEAKGIREKNIFWTCSECNNWGTPNQKYCLNCGAKMDKE